MESTNEKLSSLLRSCLNKDRESQKELFQLYYNYGMNICLHYSKNLEEAKEILNDGFYKVFENLDKYDPVLSFRGWLRRLLVNASIDYYRRYHRSKPVLEILPDTEQISNDISGFDQLALEDLMALIQRLPPAYRLVFNLYVLEGYKHEEIAEKLNITVGGSKSNLARAKQKLQQMLVGTKKKINHV